MEKVIQRKPPSLLLTTQVSPPTQPVDVGVNKTPQNANGLDLFERTQRARHFFRLRNNLANGSADALNGAKACLTFDPERRGAFYIEHYEASIDAGAKSANTSAGGKRARADILRSIEADLTKLAIRYEQAFTTDAYR